MTDTKKGFLPNSLGVGFTGHRQLNDHDLVYKSIGVVLDQLSNLYGNLAGVSSAASGADTLFLAALAERDIPFQVILPFNRSRFEEDFTVDQWSQVEPLIDAAFDLVEFPPMSDQKNAYLEAGILTLDQSDIMIAVWNGKKAVGTGGTADVVEITRSQNKPLIIIDSETGDAVKERMDEINS